jgi:hypothetical protein
LNQDIEIFTTDEIGRCYLEAVKNNKILIDYTYIDKIEKYYSKYKTIGLQMLSSQLLSSYYHHRRYYPIVHRDNQLYFFQLYYQYVEKMLDKYKPDLIFDVDIAEHGRTILLEVATHYNIPYISLEYSRYKNYRIPTFNLGTEIDDWFVKEFNNYLHNKDCDPLSSDSESYSAILNYRNQKSILASGFAQNEKNAEFHFFRDFKRMLFRVFRSIKRSIPHVLPYYRYVTTPLFSSPVLKPMGFISHFYRKWRLQNSKLFENIDVKSLNYIYIPLHVIPESTTFVKSPFFLNETFIIESVSKSLLPHQWILLKEHRTMIGERPLWFYKKMAKLPNVKFVDPFVYDDARIFIENADGVITITGTSGFEAAMLGIPVLTFGPTTYSVLSSVKRMSDVTQLPKAIRKFKEQKMDDNELASYLKVIFKWGEEVYWPALTTPPQQLIDKNQISVHVEKLYRLFKKSEEICALYYSGPQK